MADFYIADKKVEPGTKVKDFRGEAWTFVRVSREPEPGKSGKVIASRGRWSQEYYPTVFKGEIR